MLERVQKLWQTLDILGEEQVRQNLAAGTYFGTEGDAVTEWLRNKERTESSRALHAAQQTSRSANRASWLSATAAAIAVALTICQLSGFFERKDGASHRGIGSESVQ